MSKFLSPLLGAALIVLLPAAVFAQSAPQPASPPAEASAPADKGSSAAETKADGNALAACRSDAASLCKDAAKGGRVACLRQNSAKLSSECTAALADVDAKSKAMREACAEDIKTNCTTGAKGRAVVQCLRESRAKLSPACGTAFEARYAKH